MRVHRDTSDWRFVLFAITVVFAWSQDSSSSMPLPPQEDSEDVEWLYDDYSTVEETLMPSGAIPIQEFPQNTRFIVTVRILPDWGEGYRRLSLRLNYDGEIRASITAPSSDTSILSQLLSLHHEYPAAPATELAKKVKVITWEFDQRKAPELLELAKRYKQIQVPPVLPDVLYLHGTDYEFWTQSLWGARTNVAMTGPGSKAKKQSDPLLQWAEDFRELAEKYRTK